MNVLTGSHPRSRRRALGVVMGLALAGSLVAAVPAQAATSPGTACTKLNAKTKGTVAGKSVTLTCRAAAGARVWTDTRVISLSVIANAIKGGKNASTAEFIIDYVIVALLMLPVTRQSCLSCEPLCPPLEGAAP